jgi:predicted regulator of amino acid metabolism with ACT domain
MCEKKFPKNEMGVRRKVIFGTLNCIEENKQLYYLKRNLQKRDRLLKKMSKAPHMDHIL